MNKIIIFTLIFFSTNSFSRTKHLTPPIKLVNKASKSAESLLFFLAIQRPNDSSLKKIYKELKMNSFKGPTVLSIKNNELFIDNKAIGATVFSTQPFTLKIKNQFWKINSEINAYQNYINLYNLLAYKKKKNANYFFMNEAYAFEVKDAKEVFRKLKESTAIVIGLGYIAIAIAKDKFKKPSPEGERGYLTKLLIGPGSSNETKEDPPSKIPPVKPLQPSLKYNYSNYNIDCTKEYFSITSFDQHNIKLTRPNKITVTQKGKILNIHPDDKKLILELANECHSEKEALNIKNAINQVITAYDAAIMDDYKSKSKKQPTSTGN